VDGMDGGLGHGTGPRAHRRRDGQLGLGPLSVVPEWLLPPSWHRAVVTPSGSDSDAGDSLGGSGSPLSPWLDLASQSHRLPVVTTQ
jgi:hypothetical protein